MMIVKGKEIENEERIFVIVVIVTVRKRTQFLFLAHLCLMTTLVLSLSIG